MHKCFSRISALKIFTRYRYYITSKNNYYETNHYFNYDRLNRTYYLWLLKYESFIKKGMPRHPFYQKTNNENEKYIDKIW